MTAIARGLSSEVVALLPRSHFFGYPAKSGTTISPDGRWLAWLAPVDGVANIWIAPRADPQAARPLTREGGRGTSAPTFAHDGVHILYSRDADGDENHHIFAVSIDAGTVRDLTPCAGARCDLIGVTRFVPGIALIRINDRNPRYHDLYHVDIAGGTRELVLQNDAGYQNYTVDTALRPVIARLPRADGGAVLQKRDAGGVWTDLVDIPVEDVRTTSASHLDAAGTTLYLLDSRGRDTAALVAVSLENGSVTTLAVQAESDIGGLLVDADSYAPVAWASTYLRGQWQPIGSSHVADLALLDSAGLGEWSVLAATTDGAVWIVGSASDTQPGVSWIYDRTRGSLDRLFESRPELADTPLAGTEPMVLAARDDTPLVIYLTLPHGRQKGDAALPMVVVVHGGPAVRDRFGYDPEAQWLANRGYAVLKVNYRGSAGFGKAFLAAGNGQWGLKMSDDIDDAVAAVVALGHADPARVAISGGSYGGYAVLAALTRTPELYACGIDIVGPSNLETLIESIPPYWEAVRKTFVKQLGDPSTPAGLAAIRAQSPLHRAGDIRRPLLIGHGANDPRVKQAEADQMVAAMEANGVPVTYALFPDEGHGFGRPANAIVFAGIEEAFLARYLGGRADPLADVDLAASSVVFPSGGDWIEAMVKPRPEEHA